METKLKKSTERAKTWKLTAKVTCFMATVSICSSLVSAAWKAWTIDYWGDAFVLSVMTIGIGFGLIQFGLTLFKNTD